MDRLSTCELRDKSVINLNDGTNLGCPSDFEISLSDGRLTAIIILRPSGFLGLRHDRDLIIPWSKIECIGEDAILVRLPLNDCTNFQEVKRKNKNFWQM